jgi:hypothetical protein
LEWPKGKGPREQPGEQDRKDFVNHFVFRRDTGLFERIGRSIIWRTTMTMTMKRNYLVGLTALALTLTALGDVAHARGQGGQGGGGHGESPIVLRVVEVGKIARVPNRYQRGYRSQTDGCRIDPGHDFDRGNTGSQYCSK